MITLSQFGLLAKAIALVNTRGFYDPLAGLFEGFFRERFARGEFRGFYAFVATPAEAMEHIRSFTPPALASKWL